MEAKGFSTMSPTSASPSASRVRRMRRSTFRGRAGALRAFLDKGRLRVRYRAAMGAFRRTGRGRASRVRGMTESRMGGAALIAGSAGAIVTMSLHPTGHALLAPAAGASTAHLNVAVHALALFAIPALFFGILALTRRAITGGLGRAALVMHGYGVMAAMCAAVTSGFVATLVAGQIQDATAPADAVWRALLIYTGVVNRGFALVWVAATSVAILLWSAA